MEWDDIYSILQIWRNGVSEHNSSQLEEIGIINSNKIHLYWGASHIVLYLSYVVFVENFNVTLG